MHYLLCVIRNMHPGQMCCLMQVSKLLFAIYGIQTLKPNGNIFSILKLCLMGQGI